MTEATPAQIVGAVLFAGGMAWPFLVQAVGIALGALLITRMVVPPLPRPASGPEGFAAP